MHESVGEETVDKGKEKEVAKPKGEGVRVTKKREVTYARIKASRHPIPSMSATLTLSYLK